MINRYSQMLKDLINAEYYPSIELVVRRVIEQADEDHNRLEKQWGSRFYKFLPSYEGSTPLLVPVTQQSVSYDYDVADLNDGEVGTYFFLEDDGKLYPVTLGKDQTPINSDEENPFYYAAADLIANGKVVGQVIYTDH